MIETHPLAPFLPNNARVLLLGSFVPPSRRFAMPFFYPNINNDMWRIVGQVFFDDRRYFLSKDGFDQRALLDFLGRQGIGVADMAKRVHRQQDNAADRFLTVVETTDIAHLLELLPQCHYVMTTGKLATKLLLDSVELSPPMPAMGEAVTLDVQGRAVTLYRMPSSSRAYPLAFEKKAWFYQQAFSAVFGATNPVGNPPPQGHGH